jgi:hypothetical protein
MISELYSVFSEMDFFSKFFFCFNLFILALFVCCFFIPFVREEAEERKRLEKQAEEEKLKIEAEERIRAELQIWVSE